MENGTEQVAQFVWAKILLIVMSISLSVPFLEIEHYIKIYSYCVAAASGTLALVLYVFKVRDKIKSSIRKELQKECPRFEHENEEENQ